jgi:phage-related tail fiber protein
MAFLAEDFQGNSYQILGFVPERVATDPTILAADRPRNQGRIIYNTTLLQHRKFEGTTWAPLFTAGGRQIAAANVATTANITLSGLQTIDGIAVTAGQRVLVKNQTTGTENGVYVAGTGAWTRATDLATGDDAAAISLFVQQGTTNGDYGFLCINNTGSATVGTDALTFTVSSGGLTPNYTPVTGSTVARIRTFTGDIGGNVALVCTHNLNMAIYDVQISVAATGEPVLVTPTKTVNAVTITSTMPVTSCNVVVIG